MTFGYNLASLKNSTLDVCFVYKLQVWKKYQDVYGLCVLYAFLGWAYGLCISQRPDA